MGFARGLRTGGAEVITIGADPDGLNINAGCGSTHLELLKAAVVEHGADLGIAHDGDADRCLAVDATGAEVDGDQILAVLALAMREAGQLRKDTVVGTVMSNLGFKIAMEREGIHLVQTAVGDRYVLESMKAEGFALGGEQSGHVIVLDHATTGDGTLTGLMLAARVVATGRTLAELAGVMQRLPQILVNVPDVDKSRVETSAELAARSTRRSASWVTPAAYCCASRAPSRWCGSWSRQPTSSRHGRWPGGWPMR